VVPAGGDASIACTGTFLAGVTVSTLAGSDVPGTVDGTGAAAQFDNPTGIAIDANGNLLVTDYDSGLVRLVTPAGAVTTIAEGSNFVNPFAAVVATNGDYYIQTDANSAGVKDTMTGTIWLVSRAPGSIVAPTVVAENFGRPRGVAPLSGGNLFVVDRTQNVAETVTTSTGAAAVIAGSPSVAGFVNGTGASAQFNGPTGAAVMPDGSFLVADAGNNVIRHTTAGGVVTTFAGTGTAAFADGPSASASFNGPRAVAADAAGNAYVSDIGNHLIRRIGTDGTVVTIAGSCVAGFNDGPGASAEFYGQEGIAVTPDGKTVYVADGNGGDGSNYQRIRAIAMP
jgi:sugar lactone lactonase YvrE